jgi:hypothetical protein
VRLLQRGFTQLLRKHQLPQLNVQENSMITPMYKSFQALSGTQVYVLGHNGNLWLETSQTDEWQASTRGREQVDGNVAGFQALDATQAYVLGSDHNLWFETAPSGQWGNVPPPGRQHVDGSVAGFQALNATHAYVLGGDGNLWFETGPWGTVPPPRSQVDGNVIGFYALDATHAYVLGSDGNLWFETGPWGTVPPPDRQKVDGNVGSFQALDATHAYVLGSNGNLWFETGPWGAVGQPPRKQVDGNVGLFQALDATHAFVLGHDGNLWSETAQSGLWGAVPPPGRVLESTQVFGFEALDPTSAYVLLGNSELYYMPNMQGPRPGISPVAWMVDANVSPLTLPAPAAPGAPAALQISQNWPSITFDNGVPVGGYESLVMNPDGSCTFSGHFHDSGFPDYDVSIAVVVRDSGGWGYVFSAQGSMQGTVANLFSPNREYNWTTNATNQDVANRWAELSAGWTYQGSAQATADWGSMLQDLLNAFEQAGQDISTVIQVLGPLAAVAAP